MNEYPRTLRKAVIDYNPQNRDVNTAGGDVRDGQDVRSTTAKRDHLQGAHRLIEACRRYYATPRGGEEIGEVPDVMLCRGEYQRRVRIRCVL